MNPSALPCPNCKSLIEICTAKWCECVSKNLSVVCPSCKECFCKLHDYPRVSEWKLALLELLERQRQEEFRRALNSASPASARSKRVLIVDDDEEIRLIAEYTIQKMGYRTLTAANAEEALASVEKFRPDIVLTDALMPKVDGRQLCHLIKIVDPSIRVIVMSAVYTKSPYRWEAMHDFQADEYLAKPINFHRLHDVLQQLSKAA